MRSCGGEAHSPTTSSRLHASKLGKNGLKTEFCKAARDAQEASDEHSLRSGGSGDDLSPYEKARLKRIESNRAELERLDIKSAVKATTGSVPRSRPKKRNKDDDEWLPPYQEEKEETT